MPAPLGTPTDSARPWVAAALALCVVCSPRPLLAQASPTETARRLFAEGVELVAAHDYAGAEARFREALALRDAPAIRYNLASVLYEQGELPEAADLSRAAAAHPEVSADVRAHAVSLGEQISASAGFLDVEVGFEDTRVSVDGYEVSDPTRPIPVSAGRPHAVVGTVAGAERFSDTLTVSAGEHRALSLTDAPVAEPVDEGEEAPPLEARPELWIGVGVGAAVVVAAIVVGVAVASSGTEAPIEGNFNPGLLRW